MNIWEVACIGVFALGLFRLAAALDQLKCTIQALRDELALLRMMMDFDDDEDGEGDSITVMCRDPDTFKFFGTPIAGDSDGKKQP